MRKLLSIFLILFCFFMVAPLVKAQEYDGPVFKQILPADRESRSLDFRHDSVKWGGKKLVWVSSLRIRFRGSYSKRNPSITIRDKTTNLISNSKVSKRR